ncbi:hypothetical protein [Variovorax paradoxus]|uniref:hypothetical protein n=1 Tax=Variovorax paradoxus TaxID=34073 RepID=UPI003D65B60D
MAYEVLEDEPGGRYEVLPAESRGTGSAVMDAANAVGTGFWRGATRLAGLPADTMANVLDLGRAVVGVPVTAATGKTPDWLIPPDRRMVVGTGDYLIDKARNAKAGRVMLDPANPDYEGGYTQAAGGALTGVIAPVSWTQAANQAGLSLMGVLGGKAAYDATGNPALAITAGLAPTALQQVATGAVQRAVRGGEQGRRDMVQRVQDLKNAGVESPTLGLASGNKLIGGIENLLQNTPGAIGIMGRARDGAVQGLQEKSQQAAELASRNRGALESGVAIQRGVRGFADDFKARQEALYNRLDRTIPPQSPVDVSRTKATLTELNADIPNAPALSKQFRNARIQGIEDAIDSDIAGARGSGVMGAGATNSLPFEAVKKTRTLVGGEIADNTIMSDVPRSKWNPLYGALTADMKAVANAAGPDATRAFNRANDHTRAGVKRLELIAPFSEGRTQSPEQAFTALTRTTKENTSTLQAIKKSLPEEARGTVAGTVIERLGKARNGVQNDTGTAWSPETFLTNWNAMSPSARAELFSGFKNSGQARDAVESVARATSMMRENSKMWANPSGTAANAAARGILASVPAAGAAAMGGLINPWVPAGAALGLGITNGTARWLTSPGAVEWAASRGRLPPSMAASQGAALTGGGLMGLLSDPGQ